MNEIAEHCGFMTSTVLEGKGYEFKGDCEYWWFINKYIGLNIYFTSMPPFVCDGTLGGIGGLWLSMILVCQPKLTRNYN